MGSDEELYAQLTTLKLSDVTASNINTVTEPIHLQKTNEESLKTTVLLNQATFRLDGGPIPGTSVIETTTVTDDTRTVIFQPEAGSVYALNTAGALATNPSSANYTMYISNAPAGGSDLIAFFYDSSDDGTVFFTDDANWGPLYVDENTRLEGKVGGTVDAATWQLNLYRVR